MNAAGRDALIAAGMRGHRQITGVFHAHRDPGECALGVLHLTMHATRAEAVVCQGWSCHGGVSHCEPLARYAISLSEALAITKLNDAGMDFIGIARKLGQTSDDIP
jgi:hypothetical protein